MFRKKCLELERFFSPGRGVMEVASGEVVTCRDTDSVEKAIELMERGYRKLPVVREGRLAGIVTVTDALDYCGAGERHREFLKRKRPLQARVSRIMSREVAAVNEKDTLEKALGIFRNLGRGSHPVVRRGRVAGMIADWDFLKKIRGNLGIRVEELMVSRPAQAQESYAIGDVAKMMVRGGYRRLPVTRLGILTGIVTSSDMLSYLHSRGFRDLRKEKRPVSVIMGREVKTAGPEEDAGAAVRKMLASRVGGLPVVEDGELVGIITESDIVQWLAGALRGTTPQS
jgi:CBS domain-containing protein